MEIFTKYSIYFLSFSFYYMLLLSHSVSQLSTPQNIQLHYLILSLNQQMLNKISQGPAEEQKSGLQPLHGIKPYYASQILLVSSFFTLFSVRILPNAFQAPLNKQIHLQILHSFWLPFPLHRKTIMPIFHLSAKILDSQVKTNCTTEQGIYTW